MSFSNSGGLAQENALSAAYEVHSNLLIHTKIVSGARRLVAEVNLSSPCVVIKDPKILTWISRLHGTFDVQTAKKIWNEVFGNTSKFSSVFELCVKSEILRKKDVTNEYIKWQKYGWNEAYAYHEATRDYPFLKMDERSGAIADEERMVQYKSESCPPSIYQDFPSISSRPLVKFRNNESIDDYLNSLSIEQKFGIEGLSVLFDVLYGERYKQNFGVQGHFLKKAIPSGGARHPIEVFMVWFGSQDVIENGCYHYNVKNNTLDLIKVGDFYNQFEKATFDLFRKYKAPPKALLIYTVLYERAMWRYRESRSWRAVLLDVGHAVMAYRTISQLLGYRHYTYQKFEDSTISNLLNIDLVIQTPLYVGTLV